MTNKEFAATDKKFKKACELAKLPFPRPVKKDKMAKEMNSLVRQASKWRNGKGIAFTFRNQIKEDEE